MIVCVASFSCLKKWCVNQLCVWCAGVSSNKEFIGSVCHVAICVSPSDLIKQAQTLGNAIGDFAVLCYLVVDRANLLAVDGRSRGDNLWTCQSEV